RCSHGCRSAQIKPERSVYEEDFSIKWICRVATKVSAGVSVHDQHVIRIQPTRMHRSEICWVIVQLASSKRCTCSWTSHTDIGISWKHPSCFPLTCACIFIKLKYAILN